jgi:hypothetical protein
MVFFIGTFGLNFPIFLSTMNVSVFHKGAREYGLLTSTMAVGSVIGALLTATRAKSGMLSRPAPTARCNFRPNRPCAGAW